MNKKDKLALFGNIGFAVLMIVATALFMTRQYPAYIIKTIDSALFVLCGAFNITLIFMSHNTEKRWKSIFMLVGLVLAFMGDVLLIDYFIYGAIFFALGHIFFLIYFCLLQKIKWYDAVIGVGIFVLALLLILLYPQFSFKGMQILAIVYALVISLMLGKAVGNFIAKRNVVNLIIMIGAILFFFSDLMLLFNVFALLPNKLVFDQLCLITYYPAEFLLAISIYLVHREKQTNIQNGEVTNFNQNKTL